MTEVERLTAQFEAWGEDEVSRRLAHSQFGDPDRAYATRWLNERGIHRITHPTGPSPEEEARARETEQLKRAASAAGYAALAAAIAAVASLVSAGIALKTLRTTMDVAAAANLLIQRTTPPQVAMATDPEPQAAHARKR